MQIIVKFMAAVFYYYFFVSMNYKRAIGNQIYFKKSFNPPENKAEISRPKYTIFKSNWCAGELNPHLQYFSSLVFNKRMAIRSLLH